MGDSDLKLQQKRSLKTSRIPIKVALPPTVAAVKPSGTSRGPEVTSADPMLLDRLKRWRLDVARREGVPAYVVFHDRTLAEIAARSPRDLAALGLISGVGPTKLTRYGEQVLTVLREGNRSA